MVAASKFYTLPKALLAFLLQMPKLLHVKSHISRATFTSSFVVQGNLLYDGTSRAMPVVGVR